MDLQQGGDFFMEDAPGAKEVTAEKEAEATADNASEAAKDKTTEAEATADDASFSAKTKTIEAEATANDASLSAKVSSSSVKPDQALGKVAYEALAHASSINLEQGLVNVKQPLKIGAPPRPRVSTSELLPGPPWSSTILTS